MTTATCPFPDCVSVGVNHHGHAWTGAAKARVAGEPGRVYVYALVDDDTGSGDVSPNEVLVGIQQGGDHEGGQEAWLTVEQAAHLLTVLGKAIENAGRSR